MNRKKNALSYVTWLIYTVLVCGILVRTAGDLCVEAGVQRYWGIPAAMLVLAGTGGIVYLARQKASVILSFAETGKRRLLLLEGLAAAALLAVGLGIRLQGMENVVQASDYFEAAQVREDWQAPGLTHAAASVYIRLLHGLFVLLGNRFAVGIWLQMTAQLGALLLFFFAVRKLAGRIGALVCLGLCCCSPYMAGEALILSPAMPYFFLCMIVFLWTAVGYGGNAKSVFPAFLLNGILTSLCCYLDIIGILLIFMNLYVIFTDARRRTEGGGRKAAGWYMAGVFSGFFACMLAGASAGGGLLRAAENWLGIGIPGDAWSLDALKSWDFGPEAVVLAAFLALGVFGFWCDRSREHITAFVLALGGITLAGFCGVFRAEMPGFFALYVLLALCAGMGAALPFRAVGPEESAVRYGWEALIEKMEENESLREADSLQEAQERETDEEKVQFIENPLPLPKKHVKRVMDYSQSVGEEDDFDYPVSEEDDFDL